MNAWVLTGGVFDRSVSAAKHLQVSFPDGWRGLLTTAATKNAPKTKKLGWAVLLSDVIQSATKLDAVSVTQPTHIVIDLDDVGRQWSGDMDAPSRTTDQVVDLCTQALAPLGFAWWETWRSRPAEVRMRLVIPLSHPISQPASHRIHADITQRLVNAGIPADKDTTAREATRLNHLPCVGARHGVVDGQAIDPPPDAATGAPMGSPVGPVGGSPIIPPMGAPRNDAIAGDIVLEWERGGFSAVSSVTPDIIADKARPGEKRARCRCPVTPDSSSFGAFARFCRGLLYVTCTSSSHSHPSGATYSYAATDSTDSTEQPIIPHPYRMGATGALLKEDGKDEGGSVQYKTIAYTTPRITTIFQDEESGDEWWKIEWSRFNGPAIEVVLRRDECSSASKLIERAGRVGLDIHECNKRELTRFLSDYVSANFQKIRLQSVASRCGWFGDGFLWGQTWLSDSEGAEAPRELVVPSGDGRSQLAFGMRQSGTLDGWTTAASALVAYPLAMAGVYASLASVLVERINCQACVLEWASSTGTGKTTCLRIAASVWGSPDDMISGWDGTRVGLERRAGFLHNIPMYKDDTKTTDQAKNSVEPEWAVYRVVSGEGRERATPGGGMQHTAKWSLCLLLTGEEPVYGSGQSGGSRARLLSIQDPPFGLTTKEAVSRLAAPISDGTTKNSGTVGPAFAAFAGKIPAAVLRAAWDKRRQHYINRLDKKHSAADRISSHLALLETAGVILDAMLTQQGLTLGIKPRSVMERLADHLFEVDTSAGEVDPFDRGIGDFYAWCVARRSAFWSGSSEESKGPPTGWLGRWDGNEGWTSMYVTSAAIERFLRETRHSGQGSYWASNWIKRGYMVAADTRPTWKIRIAGASVWTYRIDRTASFLNLVGEEAPVFERNFDTLEL